MYQGTSDKPSIYSSAKPYIIEIPPDKPGFYFIKSLYAKIVIRSGSFVKNKHFIEASLLFTVQFQTFAYGDLLKYSFSFN